MGGRWINTNGRSDSPQREPDRIRIESGYRVCVWDAEGVNCREHRWLLTPDPAPGMHVHHINHDKMDNRLDNLVVCTPREHRRLHREISREEVVRLYDEEGLNFREIGLRLGFHRAGIRAAYRETGAKPRTVLEAMGFRPVDDDVLRQLHAAGVRPVKAAAVMGTGVKTVRRRMRELGLPSFPTGQRSEPVPE